MLDNKIIKYKNIDMKTRYIVMSIAVRSTGQTVTYKVPSVTTCEDEGDTPGD